MIGASINTNLSFLLAAISCFIPAMILLYFTLAPYEKYFKDRPLFLVFMGGMFLGGFVFFIEYSVTLTLIFSVIGYSILEQISKMVILNLPRFQGKMGTTFYGGALGLGFGSSIGFLWVIWILRGTELSISMPFFFMLVISILLFHCSTGVWLGYGIRLGSKWKYFFYSLGAQIPFYSLVYLSLMPSSMDHHPKILSSMALAYALILYIYTYRSFLPMSIPNDERRKIRMEKRREKRA